MDPARLDPINKFLDPDVVKFEACLQRAMGHMDTSFSELVCHLGQKKGKYIRPKLLLLAARIFQGPSEKAIQMACMVEFIHMASLLHDDVIDQGTVRRGCLSVRTLWGNKQSILTGDYLSAYAYKMAVAQNSMDIMSILSQTVMFLVEGEMLQLRGVPSLGHGEGLFWNIIDLKTSSLFKAALEIGGVLGTISQEERTALRDFGTIVGRLFQLVDDYSDYIPPPGLILKPKGQDFFEGKITLPALWAYQEGTQNEKQFWEDIVIKKTRTEKDFEMAQRTILSPKVHFLMNKTTQALLREAKGILQSGFESAAAGWFDSFLKIIYAPLENRHSKGCVTEGA